MSSYTGIGAWFVFLLTAEGHDVDYYLSKPEYEDVLKGIIHPPKLLSLDHRRTVAGYGYPSYKSYDLSLFDVTGRQKQAEASRAECPTFGDGQLEHLLEDDREFGIQTMEECGICVPPYTRFDNSSEAKAFIKKSDKRFVFKPYEGGTGSEDKSITYVSKDAQDMLKVIDSLWERSKRHPFILQEYVKGKEVGCAGYFNGTDFYLLTGSLEEKKFMNDNKGPNTGCSGNLIFTMHEHMHLYKEGLEKAKPFLAKAGFRGIIDLNSIVTEGEFYGLEWTPRFGYLSDPIIANMYGSDFGELLHKVAAGEVPELKWGGGSIGVSVTVSIPPYPTEIRIPKAEGVPVEGIDPEDYETLKQIFMYDVRLTKDKKNLETSGNYGYVCAPIGVGESIYEAFADFHAIFDKIQIPDMQFRTDIEKVVTERFYELEKNSWFS